MRKPWSELTKMERDVINERSRIRMRKNRAEGKYAMEWAKYHREAAQILEADFQKNYAPYKLDKMCYMCGTTDRPLRTHHMNGDYKNNDIRNLAYCCHSCDTKQAYERKIFNKLRESLRSPSSS